MSEGRRASLLSVFASILMALWAGSLWTICGIVAPTLFSTLPEPQLAGQVAARLFHIETWLGVAAAAMLVAILAVRKALARSSAALWLILLTAAAPLVSELVLRPWMEAAQAANDKARFGMLHGMSAVLFLVACVGALGLIWQMSRRPVAPPPP
jgi:hypothetical protein